MSKEPCKHIWDNPKGIKTKSKPWIGLKSKTIRQCTICDRKEEFVTGSFNGWFKTI